MALSPYRLQTDCLYILHMCDIIDQKKSDSALQDWMLTFGHWHEDATGPFKRPGRMCVKDGYGHRIAVWVGGKNEHNV